jgi:hypothetical protein
MKGRPENSTRFLRRGVVVAGAAALSVAAQFVYVDEALVAGAERVVSVDELCNGYRTGYVPVVVAFTLGELICVAPGYFNPAPGLNDSNERRVKPGNLPGLPPGPYRVNPFDPFSSWVIPG